MHFGKIGVPRHRAPDIDGLAPHAPAIKKRNSAPIFRPVFRGDWPLNQFL